MVKTPMGMSVIDSRSRLQSQTFSACPAARNADQRLRRKHNAIRSMIKSRSRERTSMNARPGEGVNRLLHAAENVIASDQREQSDPRKALLRAHGFKPRDRHVDSPATQATDEFGEHRRAGVVDFDQRIRLDHDQLWRRILRGEAL